MKMKSHTGGICCSTVLVLNIPNTEQGYYNLLYINIEYCVLYLHPEKIL